MHYSVVINDYCNDTTILPYIINTIAIVNAVEGAVMLLYSGSSSTSSSSNIQ